MARNNQRWTEEEDARLRYWISVQHYSTSHVAAVLNKEFPNRRLTTKPFTRNSVIGRCLRQKVPLNGANNSKPRVRRPRLPQVPRSNGTSLIVVEGTGNHYRAERPIALPKVPRGALVIYKPENLKPWSTCQWISGSGLAVSYCGTRCRGSYCEEHAKLVYQPRPDKIHRQRDRYK